MRDLGLLRTHQGRTRRVEPALGAQPRHPQRRLGPAGPAPAASRRSSAGQSAPAAARCPAGPRADTASRRRAQTQATRASAPTGSASYPTPAGRAPGESAASGMVSGSHGCPAARYLTACSPWRATAEQADVPRPPHRLIPRAGPELLVDGKRFRLDSVAREEHLLGDLRERQVVASMGSRRSSAPLSADSPRAVQPRSSWSRDWNSPAWTARVPRPGRRQISSSASRMSASAPARSASPMQTRMSSIPTWTAR